MSQYFVILFIMNLNEITSIADPAVAVYASLTEHQLRNRLDPGNAIFIAESPKVIAVALDAGYEPLSMLCEKRHIAGDAAPLLRRCRPDMPVYTGDRQTLASLTGYTLTRGVLCAMRRPEPPTPAQLCRDARRIAVIDGVTDTTNIGAIFRSAAALGIDAILLTSTTCDPLNRRAVRVSMGSVFLVPWAWLPEGPLTAQLHDLDFATVALALRNDSVTIDSPVLREQPRLAMILGTEGDGLSADVIAEADWVVRIPMHHGVDSLNVAAASAISFWELCKKN